MEKHILSKSTFIRGVQCLKSLHLYKYHFNLRDKLSPEQLAKFSRGINVGILAQSLFPGGIDVSADSPSQYQKSVEKTMELIEKQCNVIYEAAFQYEGVLIFLDILVFENGKYHAYEVKSSLSISDTYIFDAALQYYVLNGSLPDISGISLVYINRDYILEDSPDLYKLFSIEDVTDKVVPMQQLIENQIKQQKATIIKAETPEIDIGLQCNNPYPCDFRGHCWKHIPANSVFELNTFSQEEQFDLYQKEIMKISDITGLSQLKRNQKVQIMCHQQGREFIDQTALQSYLPDTDIVTCYLNIQVFSPAVPHYQGFKPYQPVLFLISIMKHGEIYHYFIETSENPNVFLIEKLLGNIPENGLILVYDSLLISSLLNDYQEVIDISPDKVLHFQSRLKPLKPVFENFIYYNPRLNGNFDFRNIIRLINEPAPDRNNFPGDIMAGVMFQNLLFETDEGVKNLTMNTLKKYSELKLKYLEKIVSFLNLKRAKLQ